jgi:hypothetical protein
LQSTNGRYMNRNYEILQELNQLSPLLASIGTDNVFAVPDGYFNSVAPTVLQCVLPYQGSNNPGATAVPAGYFDTLASNIMAAIKNQEDTAAALNHISKQMPFEVPAGYFDGLYSHVLQRAQATETAPLPLPLQNIDRHTPYEVPAGYFTQLADTTLGKIQQPHKVISMPRRFTRYAAAAIITGAIALGVFKITQQPAQPGTTVATTTNPSIEKGKNMNQQVFTEAINNLSEESIVNYLQATGNETDMAALTSELEELNLPAQEAYFLDNNTLDNFLTDLELNTTN